MKIVFFGDSLTWGGYGGNFVEEVRRLMPEHEIINAGEGGNTVINLLRRLERDVLSLQPDAVFIMVGGNDAISYSQPKTRSYYRQAQDIEEEFVDHNAFKTAYRDLLTQLQAAHVITWVGLEPSEYNPTVTDTLREYNESVREIARSYSVPVLDLMSEFAPDQIPERPPLDIGFILTIGSREKNGWSEFETAQRDGGYSFSFDGLHLTPDAAKLVGARIAEFIQSQI